MSMRGSLQRLCVHVREAKVGIGSQSRHHIEELFQGLREASILRDSQMKDTRSVSTFLHRWSPFVVVESADCAK